MAQDFLSLALALHLLAKSCPWDGEVELTHCYNQSYNREPPGPRFKRERHGHYTSENGLSSQENSNLQDQKEDNYEAKMPPSVYL